MSFSQTRGKKRSMVFQWFKRYYNFLRVFKFLVLNFYLSYTFKYTVSKIPSWQMSLTLLRLAALNSMSTVKYRDELFTCAAMLFIRTEGENDHPLFHVELFQYILFWFPFRNNWVISLLS